MEQLRDASRVALPLGPDSAAAKRLRVMSLPNNTGNSGYFNVEWHKGKDDLRLFRRCQVWNKAKRQGAASHAAAGERVQQFGRRRKTHRDHLHGQPFQDCSRLFRYCWLEQHAILEHAGVFLQCVPQASAEA